MVLTDDARPSLQGRFKQGSSVVVKTESGVNRSDGGLETGLNGGLIAQVVELLHTLGQNLTCGQRRAP